jgi:hypothetical protein
MIIVDKKHNLSRGFADVYTPLKYLDEVMMTAREKRDDMQAEIKRLEALIEKEEDEAKLKSLKSLCTSKRYSLSCLRSKINKAVDIEKLKNQRLVEMCGVDTVKLAYRLAKRDRDELSAMLTAEGILSEGEA